MFDYYFRFPQKTWFQGDGRSTQVHPGVREQNFRLKGDTLVGLVRQRRDADNRTFKSTVFPVGEGVNEYFSLEIRSHKGDIRFGDPGNEIHFGTIADFHDRLADVNPLADEFIKVRRENFAGNRRHCHDFV